MIDELDDVAGRSSAAVRAQAAQVADTERALHGLHDGVAVTPVRRIEKLVPARQRIAVTAAVVLVVAGVVVLLERDGASRIVSTPTPDQDTNTTPEESTATLVPATLAPADPATAAPTTMYEASTTTVPPVFSVELGQGLMVGALPAEPVRIRRVDSMLSYYGGRADYITQLWFADGSSVRVVLGADTTQFSGRRPVTVNGFTGWEFGETPFGEIVAGIGWQVSDNTSLRIESVVRWDQNTQKYAAAVFDLATLRPIANSITYNPANDKRLTAMVSDLYRANRTPTCANGVNVAGG